ncbi:MAG TPA: protein-disulfide reductase DsbD family protein [Phycisphaerae bacterium]|nr:protein-disulfide reductase DsbD family protein [Phycisphaerae bacterium]HNU46660.1 protein-disulfide reductase DsbD family protein [Phycisphaerae bacterium]
MIDRWYRPRTTAMVVVAACLLGPWLLTPNLAQTPTGGSPGDAGPKAKLSLRASVEAVVPGMPFEVGLEFALAPDWHIYWKNPGDAGLPPLLTWELPPGFTVTDWEYPVPVRHVDPGPLTTYILGGSPVLLARVTPPTEITDERVMLVLKAQYQVCKTLCIVEKAHVGLGLSVAAGEPRPAHQEFFERARRALPRAQGRYATVQAGLPEVQLTPGTKFDLLVTVQVRPGHHIQSHRPAQPNLVGAEVLLELTPGITFGPPQYPAPHNRVDPVLGRLSEFTGTVTIRVPATVDDEPPTVPVRIGGLFTYQACTEQGTCYPPETVAFAVGSGDTTTAAVPPVEGTLPTPTPADSAMKVAQGGTPPATLSDVQSTPPGAVAPADAGASAGTPATTAKPAISSPASVTTSPTAADTHGLILYLLFGFLGGLILNVMPCVLPVISIKILSFVQQAGEDRGRILRLGLAFCAGIMVYFWAFAVFSVILNVVILQSPVVIIILTAIMFVFALSLFGVFEIYLPGTTTTSLEQASQHEGYTGAFLKGVLATILGTACTAPFLAPALAWAATQPKVTAFAVFTAAGLGMALPYLLLSAVPEWMKYLPKPGPWMETFKQVMGFPLVGAAVWLLWILGGQLGADGVWSTITFLCFLAFSCWLIGKIKLTWTAGKRTTAWLAAVGVAVLGGWFSFDLMYDAEAAQARLLAHANPGTTDLRRLDWRRDIPWQPYQQGMAEELAAKGYTVYVDYTARWCATCQTNKKVVLKTKDVMRRMQELGVVPIEADWTNQGPAIAADLARFNRSGVPLNLIYPAGRPQDVIALPVLLTKSIVLEALEKAGPSQPTG